MCLLQFSDNIATVKTNGIFTAWIAVLCKTACNKASMGCSRGAVCTAVQLHKGSE